MMFLEADLPVMDPVISCHETHDGWRGITSQGEVIQVHSTNGHKAQIPQDLIVAHMGVAVGKRIVMQQDTVDIDDYLMHFNYAVDLYKNNRFAEALEQCDLTVMACSTLRAKFNRGMILLAMGRWREGLHEYWSVEQNMPFMRPQVQEAIKQGLKPWMGEPLSGKRLLLMHAHGFGDTIQMLRYVPRLKKGVMVMPPPLTRLAEQVGLVVDRPIDCDYFCPMLHLMYILNVVPEHVLGGAYLNSNAYKIDANRWHVELASKSKPRIGIAWSVGKPSTGDYPREIDLLELVLSLGRDVEIHSVQTQHAEEAKRLGVHTHDFKDFQDCAAFMMHMDEIISVDTAALHLAGAIGHPKVTGLLSYWHSWRWVAPWYNNVTLLKQTEAGDWDSALCARQTNADSERAIQ
jgi:hypothetical protein